MPNSKRSLRKRKPKNFNCREFVDKSNKRLPVNMDWNHLVRTEYHRLRQEKKIQVSNAWNENR